jgi:hypothetical protein
MPASEAQIKANQANSARSTGPSTQAGKDQSRRNALKHGLTGRGVVMPDQAAAEVDRLTEALLDEIKPAGVVGEIVIRQIATMSVRMDRMFAHETAMLARRVREALDDFEAPEGVDAEMAAKLRNEAASAALFDCSKEGILARRYEAAAQRGFYQAIKELRTLQKEATASPVAEIAAQAQASMKQLASFFPAAAKPLATVPTPPPAPSKPPIKPTKATLSDWDPFAPAHVDVPFAIGKAR